MEKIKNRPQGIWWSIVIFIGIIVLLGWAGVLVSLMFFLIGWDMMNYTDDIAKYFIKENNKLQERIHALEKHIKKTVYVEED